MNHRERQAGAQAWRVLVVDDDPDVHAVTQLVLRNKRWRDQGFELTSVFSQKEAESLLAGGAEAYHVAIVDVVMERENSGLELCGLIRSRCPRSTRIILRTGQAGSVPEETILNEYDIDYYMHKLDMDPSRLFSVVRACLRSAQDISTLLAYGKQLQSFTKALQHVSTADDLKVFMGEALQFLELKHKCTAVFNYDLDAESDAFISTANSPARERHRFDAALSALRSAHEQGLALMEAHHGAALGLRGLEPDTSVLIFEAREEDRADAASGATAVKSTTVPPTRGGLVFVTHSHAISDNARRDLLADARLFTENWCIAYATLRLRERLAHEQELRERMYHDRLESIAAMVTGVAHELNTPLGVARTAGSLIGDLATRFIASVGPGDRAREQEEQELVGDLGESVRLMNKNLDRAHRLIRSFRSLSTSQMSDQHVLVDIRTVVDDCVETIGPELKKHRIDVVVTAAPELDLGWNGYPGYLSQVVINLLQNAIRYAYEPGEGGPVAIDIGAGPDGEGFRLVFADEGRGVSEEIRPRMFEPFVTSGRELGGTGLGLAIVRNIMADILGGSIACDTASGEGTRFTIDLPRVCEDKSGVAVAAAITAPA
ncbi:hybrid sensor histidine kinase/response regulator [Kitasatospora sp. NPDC085879]|uniref:hybrid sensor histidine kinase/response regulator n=1 Tax=Kitasatospora sp. NPDC085879 TaxID=3154769 RepID=UPI003442228E